MLRKIRAIFTMIHFVVTVLITVVFMYLFRAKNRLVRQKWAKLQKYLMGYNITTKGRIDESANLLIINHQSLLDIVVLEDLHPKNLCWIAKEEIRRIPLFGHIMVAPRMISVQRENKRSLIKLLKDVKDRLQNGRVIAIFPEGTRGDGKKLLKFKKGAKMIAEKFDTNVQPIVISGSRNIFDSKNLSANSGQIVINFLPLVKPDKNSTWYEDMRENMQKVLDDELANSSSDR